MRRRDFLRGSAATGAGVVGAGVAASYVRVDGPGRIRASYGTVVEVAGGWAPERADLIMVPGGGYTRRDGPGVWAEINRGTLPKALAGARRRGLTLASLCTGALEYQARGIVWTR